MKLPFRTKAELRQRYVSAPLPGFATPEQGALAETALQDPTQFATAAQGLLAAQAYAWGNHAAAGYQPGLAWGLYEQRENAGTGGGILVQSAWTLRALTTAVVALSGATLAAGALTVPAGTYLVFAEAPASGVDAHRLALFADGSAHTYGTNAAAPAGVAVATSSGLTAIATGPAALDLRHWISGASVGATDGGLAVTAGATLERYARLLIVKVA